MNVPVSACNSHNCIQDLLQHNNDIKSKIALMREENRLLKEAVGSSKAKKGFNKTNSEQQDEIEQTDIDAES